MNVSLFSWIVILLAALAANLPFFNQQLFALVPLKKDAAYIKPLWVRLIELLVLYFVVGLVAHFLEAGIGNIFSQG